MVVDTERAADNRRIEAVLLLPHPVTHHCHEWRVSLIVVTSETAARSRAYSQSAEIVSGDELSVVGSSDLCRTTAADAQVHESVFEAGDFGELGCVVAYFLVKRIREYREIQCVSGNIASALAITQTVKLAGVGHRQRIQEHRSHQCEDRRISSNAKRQSHDGQSSKQGASSELSQTVAQILNEPLKPRPFPCRTHVFLQCRATTAIQSSV